MAMDVPGEALRPGEPIRGTLWVTAHEALRVRRLRLAWGFGKGEVGGVFLEPGDLAAGEVLRRPFELRAPPGPFSGPGVAWRLRGQIETDDGEVVAEEAPFALNPPVAALTPADLFPPPRRRARLAWLTAVVAPYLLGGLYLTAQALRSADGLAHRLVLLGAGWLLLLGAGLFARRRLSPPPPAALGEVQVTLDPPVAAPGDLVAVHVRFDARARARLNGISAQLRAVEERKPLYEVRHLFDEVLGAGLTPGRPVELTWWVRLPEDAPPTQIGERLRRQWGVAVEVDADGWPGPRAALDLQVRQR